MVVRKSIFFLGVLVITGTTFFYVCTKIFTPRRLIIRADKFYHPEIVKKITTSYTLEFFKKKKWQAFCKHLHQQLPLQSAHAHLYPTGSLVITLKAPKPYLYIHFPDTQEKGILTAQGSIEAENIFEPSFLTALPRITLNDPQYTIGSKTSVLLSFMEKLPRALHKDYAISWNNKTEIILQNLHDPFELIIYEETAFTPSFMKKVAYCRNLIAQKKLLLKKPTHWIIDARFNNQFIIRLKKGG